MPRVERQDKIKLQINVSLDLCKRIDFLAREIGMDRSQLCAYFIGKQVKQEEIQLNAASSVISQISPVMVDTFKNMISEQKAVSDDTEISAAMANVFKSMISEDQNLFDLFTEVDASKKDDKNKEK